MIKPLVELHELNPYKGMVVVLGGAIFKIDSKHGNFYACTVIHGNDENYFRGDVTTLSKTVLVTLG